MRSGDAVPAALRRATSSAAGEMSVAAMCALGRSLRQRDREAAAAGADVGDVERDAAIREAFERGLDDQLGLRTRNQHGRRHLEAEAPELLPARDVGERFARRPAGDERLVLRAEAGRFVVVGRRPEAAGVPAEQPLREQPRVEVRLLARNPCGTSRVRAAATCSCTVTHHPTRAVRAHRAQAVAPRVRQRSRL